VPRRVTIALLTGDAPDASALAITCQIGKAGELVLVVHCAQRDAARYPARHQPSSAQLSWITDSSELPHWLSRMRK
jgi:hypothetical protein